MSSTGSRTRPPFTATGYAEIEIGKTLGPTAFLVHSYLRVRMSESDRTLPATPEVAADLGLSVRKTQSAISALRDNGLLDYQYIVKGAAS